MLYSLHFHRCSNAKVLYSSHFHLPGAIGGTLGRAASESAVLFAFPEAQHRERYSSSHFHIPGALGGTLGQPAKVLYSLHESPDNPERFLRTAETERGEDS